MQYIKEVTSLAVTTDWEEWQLDISMPSQRGLETQPLRMNQKEKRSELCEYVTVAWCGKSLLASSAPLGGWQVLNWLCCFETALLFQNRASHTTTGPTEQHRGILPLSTSGLCLSNTSRPRVTCLFLATCFLSV